MFQVRHLYEHNMGVIDTEFVNKIPGFNNAIGRKYILNPDEIRAFIATMEDLGEIIRKLFPKLP